MEQPEQLNFLDVDKNIFKEAYFNDEALFIEYDRKEMFDKIVKNNNLGDKYKGINNLYEETLSAVLRGEGSASEVAYSTNEAKNILKIKPNNDRRLISFEKGKLLNSQSKESMQNLLNYAQNITSKLINNPSSLMLEHKDLDSAVIKKSNASFEISGLKPSEKQEVLALLGAEQAGDKVSVPDTKENKKQLLAMSNKGNWRAEGHELHKAFATMLHSMADALPKLKHDELTQDNIKQGFKPLGRHLGM